MKLEHENNLSKIDKICKTSKKGNFNQNNSTLKFYSRPGRPKTSCPEDRASFPSATARENVPSLYCPWVFKTLPYGIDIVQKSGNVLLQLAYTAQTARESAGS